MSYFLSLEKSQKKFHQTKRPLGSPNRHLIIAGNHKTDPAFKMVPKISTVHAPSLTDQHLPALRNKLFSYSKQLKGTEITYQEKAAGDTAGTLVYKVLHNSRELVKQSCLGRDYQRKDIWSHDKGAVKTKTRSSPYRFDLWAGYEVSWPLNLITACSLSVRAPERG